jgi:hypothetical protein
MVGPFETRDSLKVGSRLCGLLILLPFLWACNNSGSADLAATAVVLPTLDFANTELTSIANAPADGVTPIVVTVHLLNADGTPVPAYRPTYTVSGDGVHREGCSWSDSNGISTCAITSTSAGSKTFRLTNGKSGLSCVLDFLYAGPDAKLAISSGAVIDTTAGGYRVKLSLGSPWQKFRAVTGDGYTLKPFLFKSDSR